jgi:sulfate adenylyltransferase subunit 1
LPRRAFDATICWLDEQPLRPERVYLLQHGVHRVRAKIAAISGLIDVTTLQATAAAPAPSELRLNQLATVSVRLGEPIYADAYADNPPNGAFVIIDTDTSSTAGVGFVSASETAAPSPPL